MWQSLPICDRIPLFKQCNREGAPAMAPKPPNIQALQEEFLACRKLFTALGDETRQELLCALLAGPCQKRMGWNWRRKSTSPMPDGLPTTCRFSRRRALSGPGRRGLTFITTSIPRMERSSGAASLPVHSVGDGLCARTGRGTITHCRKGGEPRWNCGKPWSSGIRFGPIRIGPLLGQ